MYQRYFNEPDRYNAEIQAYKVFFDQLQPAFITNQNGYEIRIYRVN